MELKNCIKFSYCGVTRFFICDINTRFEDIIKNVAEIFEIPKDYGRAIYLTNGNGYIVGKMLFEYFILLFPQPELVFYIRLDYSKIQVTSSSPTDESLMLDDRLPFGSSKLNNKRSYSQLSQDQDSGEEKTNYVPSPVKRQNCFLGFLPRNSDAIPSVDQGETNPIAKRICRMHKDRKPLATLRTSNQIGKKPLRL